MLIEILSDLHIHFLSYASPDAHPYDIAPQPIGAGEVLVIAGDIGPWHEDTAPYLRHLAEATNKRIIFVPGNHEFERHLPINYRMSSPHQNVTVLQFGETLDIGEYRFIGATLWSGSDESPEEEATAKGFHDFKSIMSPVFDERTISLAEYNQQHQVEKHCVLQRCQIAHRDGMIPIVVSHHSPSLSSTHVRFLRSPANFLFASSLEEEILDLEDAAPRLWIHGHMHNPCDYRIGTTRVINQPLGYYGELISGFSAANWKVADLSQP